MVKRKAETSLDEWLARGIGSSELNKVEVVETSESEVATPCPTTTAVPQGGKTEQVVGTTTEVARGTVDVTGSIAEVAANTTEVAESDSGNADWFWLLLEQSGYELW